MEERSGVGGLHERRRVELAVARDAEAVIRGVLLAQEVRRLVRQVFDAGVEVTVVVRQSEDRRIGIRAGVGMAGVALAERVVEKYCLSAARYDALERQRQFDVLLPAQRQLEGLQRIELECRRLDRSRPELVVVESSAGPQPVSPGPE